MEKIVGRISEVKIGATSAEGGTRDRVITIGGATALPFNYFEGKIPNPPAISFDVFDAPIGLPKALKTPYKDVMEDPAEWAKFCVEKYGAEMVTIHLVSTDPENLDRSPEEAARTIEKVLQAVKVPIIIGGSGNPKKDPVVFTKVAEITQGERCLLASATPEQYQTLGAVAIAYGHSVVGWTSIDLDLAKQLNRLLLNLGVPKDRIVMDPTLASLGYGVEYSFSVMEKMRIAALLGDEALQMPMLAGVSNAWGAREAWKKSPELGPQEYRGPLWETVSGIVAVMSGADLLMMMHPDAIKTVRKAISAFQKGEKISTNIYDWIIEKESV